MSNRNRLPPRLFVDFPAAGSTLDDDEPAIAALAWERLLENGTCDDLGHWFTDHSSDEAGFWLRARGDRLSARSWAFWSWLLSAASADDPSPRGDNPYWPDAAGNAR